MARSGVEETSRENHPFSVVSHTTDEALRLSFHNLSPSTPTLLKQMHAAGFCTKEQSSSSQHLADACNDRWST